MLGNLHCLKARLRLLCNKYQRHSSLSLVSQQLKLCNILDFRNGVSLGLFSFPLLCLFLARGPAWVWGIWDLGVWCGQFILFLLISFSGFQYFNIHFVSLTHCFTVLVLDIQNILSLISQY